jgi:DNA modification methylase
MRKKRRRNIGVLNSKKQRSNNGANIGNLHGISKTGEGLKPKDLIGIPWMVAFALRSNGWYLRQDIIWHKPNPMPESVTDRCTKAHEYIFLMSKSGRYYYDADSIKQAVVDTTVLRMSQQIEKQKGSDRIPGKTNGNMKAVGPGRSPRKSVDTRGGNQGNEKGIPAMAINGNGVSGHPGYFDSCGNLLGEGMANKKSVWVIPTMPFKEAHFATFPEDLIIPCIKAGSPEGGIVYDPFSGAGTTSLVSHKLNRNFIGSEISSEYCKIADKRIKPYLMQQQLF